MGIGGSISSGSDSGSTDKSSSSSHNSHVTDMLPREVLLYKSRSDEGYYLLDNSQGLYPTSGGLVKFCSIID